MADFCSDSCQSALRERAAAVLGYLAPLAGFLLAVAVVVWLSGCDALSEDEAQRRPIVEAFLKADAPLPPVRISQTARVSETYSFAANALSGAAVTLLLLGDDGAPAARYAYAEADTATGVYQPTDAEPAAPTVQSGARYRLEVTLADGGALSAETVVPTAFETVGEAADTLLYNILGPAPSVRVTPSAYPGRRPIYQLSVEATGQLPAPNPTDLVPFRCALYESDSTDFDLVDTARGASPVLNEGSFSFETDGTLTIEAPWLAIAYFGETTLKASAIDDGLYTFLTTQAVQLGGGTLSPGEIPNVDSNIEGGLGVFGAYAQAERRVVIVPRTDNDRCFPE